MNGLIKKKRKKKQKADMYPTSPSSQPSLQNLQVGIPPTANPGKADTQNKKKTPLVQQPSFLPPPPHYPGVKVNLASVPQGNIVSPVPCIKPFKRGSSTMDPYSGVPFSNFGAPGQNVSPKQPTIFEKHGVYHSLSYTTYLESIAAEPAQNDTQESSPSPPIGPIGKAKVVHRRHRKMNKIRRSLRSKIVSDNGDIDLNYSSSSPSSPEESGNEDSENLDEFDFETEDKVDKALSKKPEDFFFSNEFLENKDVFEEGPIYDLLRDCRILTDEEVARRRHEKITRLAELYKNELLHLRDVIRVRHRRFFLKQVVKDNAKAQLKRKSLLNPQLSEVNSASGERPEKTLINPLGSNVHTPDINHCSVDGCQKRCVPLTNYCFNHILNDPKQKLFKGCVFKSSNGTVCNQPILVSQNPPLCPMHADLAGSTSLLETCNASVAINNKIKPLPIPVTSIQDNKEIFKRISGLISMIQSRRHRLWQDNKRTSKLRISAPASRMNSGILANPIDSNADDNKNDENEQ